MKPVYQTIKEANGDCLRCCIAALLELPASKVPNFVEVHDDPENPFPGWYLALQTWLAEKGFFFLEMPLPASVRWNPIPLPALCIFFGETTSGIKHAIVGRAEGDQFVPVFNPWPEAEFANGIAGLGFLVPRDPHDVIRMGVGLERIDKLAKSILKTPTIATVAAIRDEVSKALARPEESVIIPATK